MNTTATLRHVPTGNGEPDVFADEQNRACMEDGTPISVSLIRATAAEFDDEGLEDCIRDIASRHHLTIVEA